MSTKPERVCFVCGMELTCPFSGDAMWQANDAVSFGGMPAYGSRFDDVDGLEPLRLSICDDCLTANRDRVVVEVLAPRRPPEPIFVPWKPWIAPDDESALAPISDVR